MDQEELRIAEEVVQDVESLADRDLNHHEELLGQRANASAGAHQSSLFEDDIMLGYPRPADSPFAPSMRTGRFDSHVETPVQRYEKLREIADSYLEAEECEMLDLAFEYASKAHEGQCRKSGEPFVAHPVEVALILSDLHMDAESLCAALLHDTVEDTKATVEEVAELFGDSVAELVDGVTKISRIEVESLSDEQAQTIRKMFVAMNKDIRVIVIKLADRLHNMRTLGSLREDRRIFKSRETLEIYAPLAHRLGISSISWELEDLAFYYLEPNKYKQVARMVTGSRDEREAYLNEVISVLEGEVERLGIDARIEGRPKHLYSIYQKMTERGKGFSEIYDLIAVRLIVKDVKDCYSSLGVVHTLWHPMPGRFKDYIAMPKGNMYQSLHTTVIGPAGRPLEVQIRTEEMHRQSEYGIAAHWRYKEKGSVRGNDSDLDKQLAWLREMIDWQDETQDSREFLKSLKVDLAESDVFVFTPKGEVKDLRAGSTPIDFAYAIHTEVGNHCVGAKVNGSIVPLSYKLKTGDRVEVLTQKSASPSRDWLNLVKTPSARAKIRAYHARMSRSDNLQLGRDKLTREMKKHGMGISSTQMMRSLRLVSEQLGFNDPNDMLVQVGIGAESAQMVANRLLKIVVERANADAQQPAMGASFTTNVMPPMLTSVKRPKKHETHSSSGVVVKGIDDVLVRLSKCCNPVPGDDIIGFVTRGRGVSVHRVDCPNAAELNRSPERMIEVSWGNEDAIKDFSYKVEVELQAMDRMNLLRDVTAVLSDCGVNTLSCSSHTKNDSTVEMRFLFQLSDIKHIDDVLASLRGVPGVFNARRMIAGSQGEGSGKKKKKQSKS